MEPRRIESCVSTRSRARLAVLGGVVVGLVLAGCSGPDNTATPSPSATSTPVLGHVTTMVVLGDSMSLGVNACQKSGACPEESWAAGTDPQVDSVADRLAQLIGTRPQVRNLSRSGGRLGDAVANADEIAETNPDLFVMLLGANDACRPSIDSMTSVADFTSGLHTVLTAIQTRAPAAHLLLLSVPDLNQLWEVNHNDAAAVRLWNGSSNCTSLLGDPQSRSADATQRRAEVAARVDAYNVAIASECAAMPKCESDGGSLHDIRFSSADISTIDYFHPGVSAQAKIADAAWTALKRMG